MHNNKKATIEEMKLVAKQREGFCLSKKYVDAHTKLRWRCDKGHEWEAKHYSVKNNRTWCPFCTHHFKFTIKEMQEIASQRGGKCLSTKYVNLDTKLKWKCGLGHVWETTPYCVKNRKFWCPKCAGKQKLTIEEMDKIAAERKGKCLARKYTDGYTKLKWQCEMGHTWEASPNHIKQGSWCPICSTNVSERICKGIFEAIFNKKFQKRKPDWLVNARNNRMELDGYCKELKLAFEYQGEQHFNYNPFFHSGRNLETGREDDALKKSCVKKIMFH